MKYYASITGNDGNTIEVGYKKVEGGYEVVLSNGEESGIAIQKTEEAAQEAILKSWAADTWELELI